MADFLKYFGRMDSFGCIPWTGRIGDDGYGVYGDRHAHRVVWEHFNGPIPIGMEVLHKCDVRQCVNPAHLYLGTPQDNGRDFKERGPSRYRYLEDGRAVLR